MGSTSHNSSAARSSQRPHSCPALGLHHAPGRALTIDDGGGHTVATYHYGPDQPRSYFHPVAPFNAPPISLRPHDHVWHLGLFFSWKFVDGTNFWEPGQGHVTSKALHLEQHTPDEIGWSQRNEWIRGTEPDGPVLLRETRTIRLRRDDDQRYTIHWRATFSADEPRRLHSDPARGYAGIGIRLIRDFQAQPRLLAAGGESNLEAVRGARQPWAAWQGRFDETLDWAGAAIFEHSENPGFPAPVFVGKHLAQMAFLGSGFVFGRDHTIVPESPLTLAYAVCVHRGEASPEDYASWYEAYRGGSSQSDGW